MCQCTPRTVAIRAERTLGSLRYSFGGDHPSQTAPQAVSPLRLEPIQRKGGISTAAPSRLASQVLRLPPILHIRWTDSALRYSKGSRGLFVPLRVGGIFTATTISPSIRAGRNLPDKEFRYLRTVIVTAAVYRGFNSELLPFGMTPPLNLPAPGRCQAIFFILRFSIALCFW